jgi:tRNA dimethylallyltransferase
VKRKCVILVTGPTASGKTPLAITLAGKFQTDIISADSRQCFTELNIGVAKPDNADLSAVKHYFINSHSIHETVNAATFEKYALDAAREIFSRRDIAIMTGGTGLYIKAFCEGLDEIPQIPAEVRNKIITGYAEHGLEWLQQQIAERDPDFLKKGEMQNPQRVMRALEVKIATGTSIREWQNKQPAKRDFDMVKFGVDIAKEQLHDNINARVDAMLEQGLLKEVTSLFPNRNLNALQTVGYTELFDYLDGKTSLAHAIEQIKINTRQYAKRQMTWFRKDDQIRWMKASEILKYAEGIKI